MEKRTNTPVSPRPRRRRRRFFRLLALLVVLAGLCLLLEFSLRLAGSGYPTSFSVTATRGDASVHVDNPKFGWRFFPKRMTRHAPPFSIPAVKPEKTYRIVILGGSAALGTPSHSFSFGRMLEVLLRHNFPGVQVDLVNASMDVSNSHMLLEIARDCVKLQPDLFIVYTGNNEVLGPFGAGTIFAPLSSNRSWIRSSLAFKATRIGQLLEPMLGSEIGVSSAQKWEGMTLFADKKVRRDDPAMDVVYQHFRKNLSDICRLAEGSNVPIAVCTVATNLKDCAPIASLHSVDLTTEQTEKWEGIYLQGAELESKGDFPKAIEFFKQAAEIDNQYAELHYRLGRCYSSLEQYEEARKSFVSAREYDTLRFRADNQINDGIRAEAEGREGQGIYLVNIAEALSEKSPHSTPGKEFFYDHIHLKFDGNFLIARNIFRRLEKALPEWMRQKAAVKIPPLTRAQCATRLAYTAWEEHHDAEEILNASLRAAPFTTRLDNDKQAIALQKRQALLRQSLGLAPFRETMDRLYQEAIESRTGDLWIRMNYSRFLELFMGNHVGAEEQRRFVSDSLPWNADMLQLLSRTLRNQKKFSEAQVILERALEVSPDNITLLVQVAILLAELGKKAESIAIFNKAIALDPTSIEARYNLALAYDARWDQKQEAIDIMLEILRVAPEDVPAHTALGDIYREQKRFREAREQYNEALRIHPGSAQAYYGLGLFQLEIGKKQAAMKSLARLSKLDPRLAQRLSQKIFGAFPELKNNRRPPPNPDFSP